MKQAMTYINNDWDFNDIWTHDLDSNYGYPYLQCVSSVPISNRPRNLEVEQVDNYVSLSWEAPLPGNTGSLEYYKIFKNGVMIGDLIGLSFEDGVVEHGEEYEYYITAGYSNPDGESAASNIVSITLTEVSIIEDTDMPTITSSIGNYPNPFNPETTISFTIPIESNLRIDIYNIKGQKVKALINGVYEAGNHKIVWNGLDDNGQNVGSGIYLYRMKTDDFSQTKKMVLMK